MRYRVRFHPAVSDDLRGIARSMLPHAGKATTARVLSELRDTARSLQETPHRGSLRHEIMPGLRAIPAGRRGVVVFTVDDAAREVFISAVLQHGLELVRERHEADRLEAEALKALLVRRREGPTISAEEMQRRVEDMIGRKRRNLGIHR